MTPIGYLTTIVVSHNSVKEEVGYLWPHSPILQVGGIQKIFFQEYDEGPYYISTINWELHQYDEMKGKKINNV